MKLSRPGLLISLVLLASSGSVRAKFVMDETERVPVDRLLSNLGRQLSLNTNDLKATYQLARVHSMIYATNALSLDVTKRDARIKFDWPGSDSGVPQAVIRPSEASSQIRAQRHLTNAIHYYERALVLLRQPENETNQWWILPIHLGHGWCLDQAARRSEAIKAYRATLDIAWQEEVVGEFRFKEWIGERWEDIKARRNPLKGSRQKFLGPGVCFSEETIGYLLKLLDPVTDKREIVELEERKKELNSMSRAITPIVVPVGDRTNLAELVDPAASVRFDLDGSGLPRTWGWIKPDAAWLVFDHEGRGNVGSGLQLVGAVSFWIFWENGYQALAALDDDGNGLIERSELDGLALWQDRNGNGLSEPGEVRSAADCGVTALSTKHARDESGNPWSRQGVRFGKDDWRPTYDWLAPGAAAPSIQ